MWRIFLFRRPSVFASVLPHRQLVSEYRKAFVQRLQSVPFVFLHKFRFAALSIPRFPLAEKVLHEKLSDDKNQQQLIEKLLADVAKAE